MARVLVTGGSGFIGTNLVEALLLRGDAVLNVDTKQPRKAEHVPCWRQLDLTDAEGLRATIAEFAPEWVFHCAARTDLDGTGVLDYRVNVVGTQCLVDAVAQGPAVKRLIVLSSMLVCRLGYVPRADDDYCPNTAYGASKAEAEQIVRGGAGRMPPWVIARPTSIWGPWFGAPYREFFRSLARGAFRSPRGWSTRRSLGFVGNTVHQLLQLASAGDRDVAGKTFYVCDYEPVRLSDWAGGVASALRVPPPREVGLSLLRAGARAGDLLKALRVIEPPLTSFRLRNMLQDAVFDTHELKAVCGPLPYDVEQGIAQTVAWMRRQRLV